MPFCSAINVATSSSWDPSRPCVALNAAPRLAQLSAEAISKLLTSNIASVVAGVDDDDGAMYFCICDEASCFPWIGFVCIVWAPLDGGSALVKDGIA